MGDFSLTAATDRLLRRVLERINRSGPALVPEYPLSLGARWGWGSPTMAAVGRQIELRNGGYESTIEEACSMLDWAREIPRHATEIDGPYWENDFWGSVDALVQCAALKKRNPALYLEIGSGFSTLFARRAISDFGLRTRIVSVDPHPRTDVERSCNEVIRQRLEDVEVSLFDRLAPGDVVLLDGSHVALMNCDSTVFMLEVLPRLPAGVLIGIDDVFLPWDYPPAWTDRLYGEQYLIASHLLGGGAGWRLLFPGWWLVECSSLASRFEAAWPIVENRFGRHAGSFWFERV
jgi:Methyltransferase domain